ncbi:MAG TPA: M23 family metallopeptidase [bacterium]|nr:M23 family metallopeptidase [bacterium]
MPRPRINIMIMTQGEPDAPVRSYSLPWYAPRAAIIIGAAVVLLLLVTSVLFLYYFSESREVVALRGQMDSTRVAVEKIDALRQELIYHREFTQRIAGLLGISVPNFADSVDQLARRPSALAGLTDSGATMEFEDLGDSFEPVGVLVSACPPDPNNRPRGLPLSGRMSRGFAPRQSNPSLRHNGIDLAAREGTPVLVTADGTVEFAGEHESFGLLIVVDHGNGFKTSYGHNSLLLVREGEKVARGDRIAFSGNTGISTAPHLHYEITENGEAVDPAGFLGQ